MNTSETRVLSVESTNPDPAVIAEAGAVLRGGGLVAFPTETVYGLGANALNAAAVVKIFAAKGRPAHDPLIVHISAIEQLGDVVQTVSPLAKALAARFWPGPLTLVLPRGESVPLNVTAGTQTVAVRMPAHPVAQALIGAAGTPIAAPSANTFSRPSATTAQHVLDDLGGKIDLILDGGPTTIGLESTVIDLISDPPVILRPGGIPLEALREILPALEIQPRYLEDTAASSPGQLLKHYSPRARVLLYTGDDPETVLARMIDQTSKLIYEGKRVGVMLVDEDAGVFSELVRADIAVLGSEDDLSTVAAGLFAAMRALDARGVDVIAARDLGREGLGAAIWDRLLRAAEGRVIEVR